MASGKFSFGPYEFERMSGRLSRGGYRLKLQPKPQAILACLLDSPGELVKREDLHKRLWPEGTFVDFDLGLNVAIRKLREALDDSAETPAYVQTIPGEGYRFIAPVSGIGQAPDLQAETSSTTPLRRGIYWTAGIAVAETLAVLLLTGSRSAPLNFQSRDWVLIAAFENRTGDKLFEGSMEYALEREVSESRYINIVPRDRVNDALKLMRQDVASILTEDLARQVAVRDGGIKGILNGRIEKFDLKYLLTVRLLNPASGEIVAAFGKEVKQGGLPDAVRLISDELRRKLGEKPQDSSAGQAPRLERATTPSLAALRAFSAGMKLIDQYQWEPAAALLEAAVQYDPQFASAHIYAAHCYSNVEQAKLAAPHFQAAYRLAPGVTERERLFILGSYYQRFLHDDRRALALYQALVSLYPDDYWGVNNLASTYGSLHLVSERIEALERCAALRPNDPNVLRLAELWRYYKLDRPDKTKTQRYFEIARRLQRAGVFRPGDSAYLDLESAGDSWRDGDVKGAAREVAWLSSQSESQQDDYKSILVMADLLLGRISAVGELCRSIREPSMRGECLLRLAYVRGDRPLAKKQFSQLQISGLSIRGRFDATVLAALLGETALATIWMKHRFGIVGWDETLNGLVFLSQGQLSEARRKLEGAFPQRAPRVAIRGFLWNRYGLACVLERQGRLEEAITRLEDAPASDVIDTSLWQWLLCRAKLGQLYRKVGRLPDATKTEDDLRHYLSEADPDHPLLAELNKVSSSRPHVQ